MQKPETFCTFVFVEIARDQTSKSMMIYYHYLIFLKTDGMAYLRLHVLPGHLRCLMHRIRMTSGSTALITRESTECLQTVNTYISVTGQGTSA